jgi:transposase
MRKSFDGLFGIIKNEFSMDVRDGGLFLFINLRRNRVKLLYWDTDGLVIWMKRLERGSLQHPQPKVDAKHVVMDSSELNLLLSGIELSSVKRRKRYVAPNLEVPSKGSQK